MKELHQENGYYVSVPLEDHKEALGLFHKYILGVTADSKSHLSKLQQE